ncbi:MAG TPA: PspC domain-containing protein [Marmoricola sp.]|nr:PspC domain-containing protein [Marmoricola sp.]
MTETDERPPGERPSEGPHAGPRVSPAEMRDLGRLRRSRTDRRFAGVAGGLAQHFDVDPTIVRVVFVVTTFFGGAGLLAYAALWLVVPEEGSDHAVLHLQGDARRTVVVIIAALAGLILLGNAWGSAWSGAWQGLWHVSWLLLAIALLALLAARRDRRRAPTEASSRPGAPVASYDAGTGTTHSPDAPVPPAGDAGEPTAPLPWQPPTPPPPARPRRTGIVWFWPTLALLAIGLGTLAVVEAGRPLAPGSYAALALAIIGAVLVLSAFVGRGGGLIALGVLAGLALVVTTTAGRIGLDSQPRDLHPTPTTAAAVQPRYHVGTGRILLDLSQVSDPAALDGRTVEVSNNVGDIEVTVPRGVQVVVDAHITYVGGIHVDGESRNGSTPALHTVVGGGAHAPQLTLDLHERVGQIKVLQEGAFQ